MWLEQLNNKEIEELEKGLSSIFENINVKFTVNPFGLYEVSLSVDNNEIKRSSVFGDYSLNIYNANLDMETRKKLDLAYCSFMTSKFGKAYIEMAKADYRLCFNSSADSFYEFAGSEGPNSDKAKHYFDRMNYNNDMWIALDKHERSLVSEKIDENKNEF